MNIIDYIKGNRKGVEANRLEKDAMRDPFMQEAMEGFDAVEGDHMARLSAIQRQLSRSSQSAVRFNLVWKIAIAASVVILALVGRDVFTNSIDVGLQASNGVERPIDIYVPQAFYQENIAVIACINTELTKDLSVVTDKSQRNNGNTVPEEEFVGNKKVSPLNLYFPQQ